MIDPWLKHKMRIELAQSIAIGLTIAAVYCGTIAALALIFL